MRLRALEAEGALSVPVIAVNEARAERAFNDRFGAGQSVLDGIVRATNILLAGQTVVVLGYGWTGRGVALRAAGFGASVIVCEVDPLRALEARMEGFAVMPAVEGGSQRATCSSPSPACRTCCEPEHFEVMKDGAVLANAGQFDVEISLADLRAAALRRRARSSRSSSASSSTARALHLLAGGRVVNLAAAEGHPAAVMDVSFALQALAAEALVRGTWAPGVHAVPDAIEREVAALKLAALRVDIDSLTDAQADRTSSLTHRHGATADADLWPPRRRYRS